MCLFAYFLYFLSFICILSNFFDYDCLSLILILLLTIIKLQTCLNSPGLLFLYILEAPQANTVMAVLYSQSVFVLQLNIGLHD